MCVLFEFRHFFNSENSSTYFKVSCISAKNSDRRDYIINGICADGEQAKAFWFSEGRTKV